MKKFKPLLLSSLLMSCYACSDDTEVQQQAPASAEEGEKEPAAGDNCKKEAGLSLAPGDTFHSSEVQGILGFCAGCHTGPGGDADIDLRDYDRMLATFSAENISLSRIVEQVENDHQDSNDPGDVAILQTWASNGFARGTADGTPDDSPFYDDGKGDNGLDLDDFDPFAEDAEGQTQDCAP